MPVTEEIAKVIVNRFSSLPKFPRRVEGIRELTRAMETAPGLAVAEQWANGWIYREKTAPLPSDIYGAFNSPGKLASVTLDVVRLPSGEFAPPRHKCNLCEDTGWYIVRKGKKAWEGIEYEGAERCHHPVEWRGELYGRVSV